MITTKNIYLDNAAATPVLPQVQLAMQPFFGSIYGNPSSLHTQGRLAREATESARETIAKILDCGSDEIIFTSGGTESDLLAIRGVALSNPHKRHIITSQIEHPAVLTACETLATEGFDVTYLPPDQHGLIAPRALQKAIRPSTGLISIMYANNEIGIVQPLGELAGIARQARVPFHTDACQAAGSLSINVQELGIDLMTLNGSKIYGPKGAGLLYIRNAIDIAPIMPGGGQEQRRRGGTENVAGIVGLAKALELVEADKEHEIKRLTLLRDLMITEITKIPGVRLTGHPTKRLVGNVHVTVEGLDGQTLVSLLDQQGIMCSAASACTSASPEPSHVLLAIGLTYEQAFQGVRFSLGRFTTKSDVIDTVTAVRHIMANLTK